MRTNFANTGKTFERAIEATARQYCSKDLMRLRKVDPPLRYAGGRIIHLENPFLDWTGVWSEAGGRAIFIEAKSTARPKLRLCSGGLSDSQLLAMHAWDRAGAVVFLLWECGGQARLWTEPMVRAKLDAGIKHLCHGDGHIVPQGQGWVLYDFRLIMLKLWP